MDNLLELKNWIEINKDFVFDSGIEFKNLNDGVSLQSLSEFERAYKKVNSKLVFSSSLYFHPELYAIDLIDDKRMIDEIRDEINRRIAEHNEVVFNINLSDSLFTYVYFFYEGIIVYYLARNESLDKMTGSEETLEIIKSEVFEVYDEEKIKKIRLELKRKAEEELEPITNMILVDEKFHSCSNASLRMKYMKELLIKNPEFKEKFSNAGFFKTSVYSDYVWRIYKDSKKN